MTDGNPEDTFTFVDKRRLNQETETDDATSNTPQFTDIVPDEPEDFDEPLDEQDALGSYGLVSYVTGLIASDAWQRMGLITDPMTGKINPDLSQARFSIDCVSALVGTLEKHESSIPMELLRDLQRVLSDLRMNFVEQSHRQAV